MRISESLRGPNPHFSFEFFLPKSDEGVRDALLETTRQLRALRPGFVSVTYGEQGGFDPERAEIAVAKRIKRELEMEVLAHVTCVGHSAAELRTVFTELAADGIENVLALRGDPPKGQPPFIPADGGFRYATELLGLLSAERGFAFCTGAAAYPEVHPEAVDAASDLENALRKVDAGAEFLITQLFFDNERYFAFVERARAAGVRVPIVPGIMPITGFSQVARMTAMCGATIPPRLLAELESRKDEPEAVAELGVAYATLQCADLLARGAPGIHFYTLNRSPATRAVVSALLAGSKG